jgi:hypothetical protein
MTKEEALRFKENWAVVNRFVIEEARRATLEERLRGVNTLFRAARSFGWGEALRAEDEVVRNRWRQLKEKLGGGKSNGGKGPIT